VYVKVLFATLDVRLNNKIIELLNLTPDDILELEYIEDLEEKAWETNPRYIFIGNDIDSKSNGRLEPLIYQAILELKEMFNTIYITDQQKDIPLIQKLLEKGFFNFASRETPLETPKNPEQAKEIFLKDIDIPTTAPEITSDENTIDLPLSRGRFTPVQYIDESRSIVTAIWSPIPNVGAGTFARALAFTLAKQGRKTLLVELDWEYSKLARTTALTHKERNLKNLLRNINKLGRDVSIEDFVVNAKMAEDDLPHTHKQAKQRLKKVPLSLFVLCREATAHYEEEPELPDERGMDRFFFECKRVGFQHIIVDLHSNPNNVYTMLSLLAADEKFVVVDDTFSTSGFFKMAMEAFGNINLSADSFELVINKIKHITAQDVSEFYDKTPVLSLPYCDDMSIRQLDLQIEYSDEFMKSIRSFVRRYGVIENEIKKEKKPIMFAKGR
jgi:MinD-like ATPase involved in chromosome partitioning or flagellar assembly